MSSLHKVLREYSVPLQIWLAPDARAKVAETIIPSLEASARIETQPMPQIDSLNGPAVLVISAKEISGSDREGLRRLAQKAHPGRAVLIGGTSDRDTLMDAINNWGVIRVLPSNADAESIVEAIQAAGAYLNREVAMETAIDDLDIETTMIDSAIDQLHGNRDQIHHVDRTNMTTTFAAGMMTMAERERVGMEALEDADLAPIQGATQGLKILTHILEMAHDFAIEMSAGIPITPYALDPMVDGVRSLFPSSTAGHSGSGVSISMDPHLLFQTILSFARNVSLETPSSIDAHQSGEQPMITLSFTQSLPADFIETWTNDHPRLWNVLQDAGVHIRANNDANEYALIELILPTQVPLHG